MLKYLYTVRYNDGTEYKQNAEDISITNPEKSCFYDINIDEVRSFTLHGNDHQFYVELRYGSFMINGVRFSLYEEPLENQKLRLIFFRKHTHTFSQGIETDHKIVYRFGWQFLDDTGKNVQRVIEII
ncbi:MAG: hypothetical protein ABSB40_13175 [Nitrososphaeria archaeon]|jgi:hypothetical protein